MTFVCRYCGNEKEWSERNYDMGLALAERNSLDALGHCEGVSPYLICNDCAKDILREGKS